MRKIILTLIVSAFYSVAAFGANPPTIGTISNSNLNSGTGSNFFLIPVNDGDHTYIGNTTITVTSSNQALLQISNINYNPADAFASINLSETGIGGVVTVTVSAVDADGTTSKSFAVNIGNFWQKGLKFKVFDIVFYQHTLPNESGLPKLDTVLSQMVVPPAASFYQPLHLNAGPSLKLSNVWNPEAYANGFTNKFSGYFVPPATGTYTFKYTLNQDSSIFYFGSVAGQNIYMSKLVLSCGGGPGSTSCGTSFSVNLTAGEYYPFYNGNWLVFTKASTVSFTGPGVNTFTALGAPYVYPDFDRIKPATPLALSLVNKGVNFITLRWKKSTDNDKVNGYNVYSNGIKIASIKDSLYVMNGLSPLTLYSLAVTALDRVGNESPISNILNVNTYGTDITAPSTPTIITQFSSADMSAEISWRGAKDIGSEVIGYNVYLNGELYTTNGYTRDSSIVIKVLTPNTTNIVTIEAIDGAFNKSDKSAPFNINTVKFDPLLPSVGVKKARVNFNPNRIALNAGFGINADFLKPDSYTGTFGQYQTDLEPGVIRWGALTADPLSFYDYVGAGKPVTIAKFMDFCISNNAYAEFTCGVKDNTDWRSDINTFKRFMEYIGDPSGQTTGSGLRVAEGHIQPILPNIKGIIIELGNEVWGGADPKNLYAEIGGNYVTYGQWCRSVAGIIKSSPYYDSTKIFISYSGKSPSTADNFGLHTSMLQGDKHEVDWISISGYTDIPHTYDPNLPAITSELNYYKDEMQVILNNIAELQVSMDNDISQTGKYRPFYFYEGNMSDASYFGRLGQGIMMSDYFLSASKYGVALPSIFALSGGQWSITDGANGDAKFPFFNIAELLNKNSKGNIMKSDITSLEKLRSSTGITLNGDPVGIHMTNNGPKYTIAMFSRDFDNDYQVQLILPKNGTYGPSATKYVVSGADFNTASAITTTSAITLTDSMIVTIPKYSFILFVFDGPDLGLPLLPLGYTKYKKIDALKILSTSGSTNIDIEFGSSVFTVSGIAPYVKPGVPLNAVNRTILWRVFNPDGIEFSYDTTSGAHIFGSGNCQGNGTVILKAMSAEDTTVFDQINVTISNQIDEGLSSCAEGISKTLNDNKVTIYPNPSDGTLNIVSNSEKLSKINIYNVNGMLVFASDLQYGLSSQQVQISTLPEGLYFVNIQNTKGEIFKRKLMKR